jgi:hypothetical protein
MALDVIDISAEGLAAYVVPECRTGRPQADLTGRKGGVTRQIPDSHFGQRRLTECEAFLLRLGRKALELEGLRW